MQMSFHHFREHKTDMNSVRFTYFHLHFTFFTLIITVGSQEGELGWVGGGGGEVLRSLQLSSSVLRSSQVKERVVSAASCCRREVLTVVCH